MEIEVTSLFAPGDWKDSNLDQFKRLVNPINDDELSRKLAVMEAGQEVLSAIGTLKFRVREAK